MKKFLIGCAISAGVLLLIGIGGSFYLVKRLKDSFPDIGQLEFVEKQLLERDGEFESEIMPLDGSLSPEMLDRYVNFQRVLHRRAAGDAREFQAFLDEEDTGEEKGRFHEIRMMVRGGLDVARASVKISGVADSLLLSTGLTRGECVYLTVLVRYGATDFEAPHGDSDAITGAREGEGEQKVLELIDELEEELERRAFTLFANQRRELRAQDQLDERQEAWLSSLEFVLEDRPRTLASLEDHLLPWQRSALEPRLDELRATWPTSPAAYFLELLPRIDSEDDGGFNVEFN